MHHGRVNLESPVLYIKSTFFAPLGGRCSSRGSDASDGVLVPLGHGERACGQASSRLWKGALGAGE